MKRILLIGGIIISAAAAHAVFGQPSVEGIITYETSVNMHRNLPPERQDMKSMIPEYRTSKEQLFYNATESLYKPVEEDEEQEIGGGGGMRIRMMRPQTETYTNSSNMERLVQQDLFGKKYLVVDTIEMDPWKFGSETKEILGYVCRQAYFTRTDTVQNMRIAHEGEGAPKSEMRLITQEITAWYTDKIRPFLGPDRFNTLPGTVLAIDVNNGERVIVARNIENKELKKNELKAPSAGSRISRAEFRKLMDEQMQKMRQNGRGGMMMRN